MISRSNALGDLGGGGESCASSLFAWFSSSQSIRRFYTLLCSTVFHPPALKESASGSSPRSSNFGTISMNPCLASLSKSTEDDHPSDSNSSTCAQLVKKGWRGLAHSI